MINSNLQEVSQHFEQKELELRQLAAQRAKQLEQLLVQREKKLKEQDLIIRAQMEKIADLQQQNADQSSICEEYESRFKQLKDAIDHENQKHQNEKNATKQDIADWTQKYERLEEKLQGFLVERSELLSQLKDAQWAKDQEQKKFQREIAQLHERLNIDKQSYLKQLDGIKMEIQYRHSQEIKIKNQDAIRTENVLTEKISQLEQELSQRQLNLLQQRQVEDDLRQKCELLTQKNEKLRLDLFNSGDQERKQSLELAMQVNGMKQDLETREIFQQKQLNEVQLKLQTAILDKERLTLELQQATERVKYQEVLHAEKMQIEAQRLRGTFERQLQQLQQQVLDTTEEKQTLSERINRLNQQVKDKENENRRDTFLAQKKLEETESGFEHQCRELRANLVMKNKEIHNLNEEVSDLTSRLDQKVAELKNSKVLLQKQQARNQELQNDIEQATQNANSVHKKIEQDVDDEYRQQIENLQSENNKLRQLIQKLQASQHYEMHQSRAEGDQNDFEVDQEQRDFADIKQNFHESQPLMNGVLSPILSQEHRTDTEMQDIQLQFDAQNRQIAALLQHNELVNNHLQIAQNENFELKKQLDYERSQVLELRKSLFSSQSKQKLQGGSQDQNSQVNINQQRQSVPERLEMIDKLQVLNSELTKLQNENLALKTKLVEQDRLVKSLRSERDQLLEISQSLKIQLHHSDKKNSSSGKVSYEQEPFIKGKSEKVVNKYNNAHLEYKQEKDSPTQQRKDKDSTTNEIKYMQAIIKHLRESQNMTELADSTNPLIEDVRRSTSQENIPKLHQLLHQRLSEIPGFENFQPNMGMFDQTILSALSEHLNKSKSRIFSPSQASMQMTQGLRKSQSPAQLETYSSIQKQVHENNDENSYLEGESITNELVSQTRLNQIKNQTFGEIKQQSLMSNDMRINEMLSPGMQEEGIANIAVQNNNYVNKVKDAAKARLQALKQTYIMDRANDIFPVRDD